MFRALSTAAGLAGWWSTVVTASSEGVGGVVHFTFAGDFNPEMQITELDQSRSLGWRCIGGHGPWADNTFRFELVDHEAGTRLRFWQHYAVELEDDYYGVYNYNWGYYLESLRLYVSTGQGKPFDATPAAVSAARA